MPDNLLILEIITPKKIFFKGEVKSFSAPGVEGGFQILPKHAPFISNLQPGKVKYVTPDNNEKTFAAGGGVVEVHNNQVSMLAESIEPVEEIDVEHAKLAKESAEKIIAAKEPGTDIEGAKMALLGAKNRLKLAGNS